MKVKSLLQKKKGAGEIQPIPKALHSPRQTTVILSAPLNRSTDIHCPNLTDVIDVQVLVYQLSQGCQKLILFFIFLLSNSPFFKLYFLLTIMGNKCPCKDIHFLQKRRRINCKKEKIAYFIQKNNLI